MMTVKEFISNRALMDEYGKMIRSGVWAALMDVAKTSCMRPPDPRIEKVSFGNVDPNHAAPILYGIALGKWEVIDILTNLQDAGDLAVFEEPVEDFGAMAIMAKEQAELNGKKEETKDKKGKVKNGKSVK